MRAIRTLIAKLMTIEKMIMSGVRTAMRMIIWNAFCTFVTSVVIRVIRDDVENLSTSANEKSWMWKKRSCRRFFAKPALAVAAARALSVPKSRENIAMMRSASPVSRIGVMEFPVILSMRWAMSSGRIHSRTTSPAT